MVMVDTSILPATLLPINTGSTVFPDSALVIQPPADSGFKNITFYALDGIGFSVGGNHIIGKPTAVHLVTEDIAPSGGFSSEIGTNASFYLSVDLLSYPCDATLTTKILGGVTSDDDSLLWQIASNNSAVPAESTYTAKVTKTNFPTETNFTAHMSVNSNLKYSGEQVCIWRISEDRKLGQILPTTYLYSDNVNNLDYFEADSPLGLSTFGISSFDGPNNLFGVIALASAEVVNPEIPAEQAIGGMQSSGEYSLGAAAPPEITPASAPDSGKTADIAPNEQGTQAPVEEMVSPAPTLATGDSTIISAKPAMLTNIEMFTWLISIVGKNPVILVVVLAACAAVAYFGWWKRRL